MPIHIASVAAIGILSILYAFSIIGSRHAQHKEELFALSKALEVSADGNPVHVIQRTFVRVSTADSITLFRELESDARRGRSMLSTITSYATIP